MHKTAYVLRSSDWSSDVCSSDLIKPLTLSQLVSAQIFSATKYSIKPISKRGNTMNVLYTAVATSTGGRDGRAVSSDKILDVKLATPKALGGAGGEATNPEQLFAAGYSACFIGALKFVASQSKRSIPADASITAHVGIEIGRSHV